MQLCVRFARSAGADGERVDGVLHQLAERLVDHPVARDILEHLSAELPEVTDWAGTVGVGIAASNVEYFDEPALAVMLCDLPPDQYRVFSGVAPLGTGPGMGFEPHTALLHADARHRLSLEGGGQAETPLGEIAVVEPALAAGREAHRRRLPRPAQRPRDQRRS